MEDSPMYDPITIASRVIGSYTVFFTDDINKSFEEKSRDPSAVFLIDKKLTTFYTEEINIISKTLKTTWLPNYYNFHQYMMTSFTLSLSMININHFL